ncbi:MAG: GAF domain-containing sensor histidine kinase, partial [Chloroflexota bacterium]
SQTLVSARDPEQQVRAALDEIVRLLDLERVFLFRCHDSDTGLFLKGGRDSRGNDALELEGSVQAAVESARMGRPPRTTERATSNATAYSTGNDIQDRPTAVAAPLFFADRLVGAIYLDGRHAGSVSSGDDLAVALAIGGQVAMAVEAAETFTQKASLERENISLADKLHLQVEGLEKSRQQITAAEERLRQEIAELLHSRVQTRLLMAWHRLGQCAELVVANPERAVALLAEVREDIDQIREREIRQASHLLHPSIIRIGLVPATRSLVDRFEDFFRISLQVDPQLAQLDDPYRNRIAEPVRLTAYRVLEEAFNNIDRHARATLVEVSLTVDAERRLRVVVRDNGRGFDPVDLRMGLGLNSIAGRVGQFGGTWEINSVVDEGTTLIVYLPLVGSNLAPPT